MKKQGALTRIVMAMKHNRVGELLVHKGLISKDDLSHALRLQKDTGVALGEIFIQNNFITQRQLKGVLRRQFALRVAATGLLFGTSLFNLASKRAQAEIRDVPGSIVLASASQEFQKVAYYPKLMGTAEKRDRNLKAFTKWTGMFDRFEQDLKTAGNVQLIRDWQRNLNSYQNLPMKQMAEKVNTLVNQTRYIQDKNNWGKSDYWATPVEFLKRGGDCEDFAIAKYTALRSLGVPEERLRIAIVQDLKKNIPHAVLIVYTDEGSYILDNQSQRMVSAESGTRYKPIFSINRQAWWLHKSPSTTVVASAR